MEEEIIDTSGFYKKHEEELLSGPTVYGPQGSFTLLKENKNEHTYPVDGWYWFDSEEEAHNVIL